jgi:hypothetical protein
MASSSYRLIVAIADAITPQVVHKYRVSIEERVYTSTEDLLLVGIADVAISRRDATSPEAILTAPTTRLWTERPYPSFSCTLA